MPTSWRELSISITCTAIPKVGETNPGTVLPSFCPERHIQSDKSFCIGLDRPLVESPEDAELFWSNLHDFLRLQSFAHKTKKWPPKHAFDHGGAAEHQQRAESIAKLLDIESAYQDATAGLPSWITTPKTRYLDENGELIDRRKYCPLGCRHKRKKHRLTRRKCGRELEVQRLIIEEQLRRRELFKYWLACKTEGKVCCQSMSDCPLRLSEQELKKKYATFIT